MENQQSNNNKPNNPFLQAIVNIKTTSNWLHNRQNVYMSQFDMSMPQFNILRILRGAKDFISINTIKDRMIEKSPNTTRLLDKLLEKNLIERVRCDKDKRITYVQITSKGLELLQAIDNEELKACLTAENLSESEAIELNRLLDKVKSCPNT